MGLSVVPMEWQMMLAVLARIGAALAVSPPFAHAAVPRRVRAMMAIAIALGLWSTLSVAIIPPGTSIASFALALGGEVLIGLAMGMAIALVFAAATWTGELVSQQLGLNLSEAYDPSTSGGGTP